jgi:trans-aconitate methyltransferase
MHFLMSRLLEWPPVYRAWMASFAEQKFRPVREHTDLSRIRRVLDVGCGPGTYTAQFENADYLGIDINAAYIESARRRFNRTFVTADVTTYRVPEAERFDLILINSLLHHLDDQAAISLLNHVSGLLTDDGCVHAVELVMPEERSIARFLTRHDRGLFARAVELWAALFGSALDPLVMQTFPVRVAGVTLWHMLYYMGRAK